MCWVRHRGASIYDVGEGAGDGAAERPDGHLGGHRALVFDRSADVAGGSRLGAGRVAGPAEQLLRRLLALEDLLRVGRRERGLGHRGEADAGVLDAAVRRQPDDDRGSDRGEVADLALELRVGAARALRPSADADLREDLRGFDRGLERVEEEVTRLDQALPGLAAAHDRGVDRQEHRRPVARRVRVRDRAADRAPVAHLRVADHAGQVDEGRVVVLDDLVVVHLPVRGAGPDAQLVVGLGDAIETGDVAHVDQEGRLGEAELDERDEAVATRQQLGLALAVLEDP